ncbi:RHS repeat-associated protein [Pelomyxa schiedti]|nr:RHS repeat-associated protein [Pelomyxa schiedti]
MSLFVSMLGGRSFEVPYDVCIDTPRNRVVVADWRMNAVWFFPGPPNIGSVPQGSWKDCGPRHKTASVDLGDKVLLVGGRRGFEQGSAIRAAFQWPIAVAVANDGTVYLTEQGNHCIRKVSQNGNVSLVAGNGTDGFSDGRGAKASFFRPWGIAIEPASGDLIVCDVENHRIRRVTTDGTVTTLAGTGEKGSRDGPCLLATFSAPRGLVFDSHGNLFIADTWSASIRMISQGQVSTLHRFVFEGLEPFCLTAIKFTSDERQFVISDPRNQMILFYCIATGDCEIVKNLAVPHPMGFFVGRDNEVYLAQGNSRALVCIKLRFPTFQELKPLLIGWKDSNSPLNCLPLPLLQMIIDYVWACSIPVLKL